MTFSLLSAINKKIKPTLLSDFTVMWLRILVLYLFYFIGQIGFVIWNSSIIEPISLNDISSLITGAFIFNSVSVFYINIPFIILSLLPLPFSNRNIYQRILIILFVATNSLALLLHYADIFYYPFKLGRISSDDLHYFSESNNLSLLGSFIADYWYGFVGFAILVWLFYKSITWIPYKKQIQLSVKYYIVSPILLSASIIVAIFFIRGGSFSASIMPINMSDATMYANKPSHSSIILSNPFCLMRTFNHNITFKTYFSDEEKMNSIFNPVQTINQEIERKYTLPPHTNIVFIILESYGSAHLQMLNPLQKETYTPFLDSIMRESLLFTKAFHNGKRSMDALPSIWASIPSYKDDFLSLPQSVAPIDALPAILAKQGYSTAFLHGAVHSSMGFVSFGRNAGVTNFFCREEYEQEYGTNDFDGKWGIWDNKFLPFAEEKISTLQEPFCATIFTMSTHHPFALPKDVKNKYKEGALEIYKTLRFSDDALRDFFKKAQKEPWFANTLFVFQADHSSGQEHKIYASVPYNFAIPIFFYKPNSNIKGTYDYVFSHIDIKPTILGMMNYSKPFFAFGTDVFGLENPEKHITINYFGGYFNCIGNTNTWIFDETKYTQKVPTKGVCNNDELPLSYTKAYLQQYYNALKNKKYTP